MYTYKFTAFLEILIKFQTLKKAWNNAFCKVHIKHMLVANTRFSLYWIIFYKLIPRFSRFVYILLKYIPYNSFCAYQQITLQKCKSTRRAFAEKPKSTSRKLECHIFWGKWLRRWGCIGSSLSWRSWAQPEITLVNMRILKYCRWIRRFRRRICEFGFIEQKKSFRISRFV